MIRYHLCKTELQAPASTPEGRRRWVVDMCLQKLCPDFPFVINSLLEQYTKAKITEHISVEKLKKYGYSTADIANISCEAGMLLASD